MKLLFLLFLMASRAWSQNEIELRYDGVPFEYSSTLRFIISDSGITRTQNSNFFSSPSDLRLGVMRVDQTSKKKIQEKLQMILVHFQQMDKKMKVAGKSWNETTKLSFHQRTLKINDLIIPEDSPFFKEAQAVMAELIQIKTELKDGMELLLHKKQIQTVKNAKFSTSKDFVEEFNCKSKDQKKICYFGDLGALLLQ